MISSQDAYSGVYEGVENFSLIYPGGIDFTSSLLSRMENSGVDTGVLKYVQAQAPAIENMLNQKLSGDVQSAVKSVFRGLVADLSDRAASASKDFGIALVNTTKSWTQNGMTISESYKQVMSMNQYVEKATGKVVLSSNVLSEVTHLPLGKVLADTLPFIGKTVIAASMWDTINSIFQVETGVEANTLAPLKNMMVASSAAITTALLTAGNPAFLVVGGGLIYGALVGYRFLDDGRRRD